MDADTLFQNTCDRLRRHEGQYAEIARQNPAISYSWLTKLAHGQMTNPTVGSLQQLIDALDAFEGVQVPEPVAVLAESDPDAGRIEPMEGA